MNSLIILDQSMFKCVGVVLLQKKCVLCGILKQNCIFAGGNLEH